MTIKTKRVFFYKQFIVCRGSNRVPANAMGLSFLSITPEMSSTPSTISIEGIIAPILEKS